MFDVIISVEACKMAAKQLHYCAKGTEFYALHLLADKVDFGSSLDDLKEAYYLGFKRELPPNEGLVAIEAGKLISDADTNSTLNSLLYARANYVVYAVEEAKREAGLPAGVHAILDGISQNALVIMGLCGRTAINAND